MESTVLHDGWFKYRLKVYNNPYLSNVQFTHVSIPSTNIIEQIGPSGWTNLVSDWDAGFSWENTPSVTPYELVFLVRSSETHYRSNRVLTLLQLNINEQWDTGVVGYMNMPALVPCSAEEADGSPSRMLFEYGIADMKIDELIRTNNQVHGVRFSNYGNCTVELEGSHNLKEWEIIARFHGTSPSTTWTTNSNLNAKGKFFRLSMVASYHMRLASGKSTVKPIERARLLRSEPKAKSIDVDIETVPGSTYTIQVRDLKGTLQEQRKVHATGPVTTVTFLQQANATAYFIEASKDLE